MKKLLTNYHRTSLVAQRSHTRRSRARHDAEFGGRSFWMSVLSLLFDGRAAPVKTRLQAQPSVLGLSSTRLALCVASSHGTLRPARCCPIQERDLPGNMRLRAAVWSTFRERLANDPNKLTIRCYCLKRRSRNTPTAASALSCPEERHGS